MQPSIPLQRPRSEPAKLIQHAAMLLETYAGTGSFGLRIPRDRRLATLFAVAGAAVTVDLDHGIAHVDLRGATRHG